MTAPIAYVIRGGRIMDGTAERLGDVAVGDDGLIVGVAPTIEAAVEIDAGGCLVSPGFVDLNAHLGEPGDASIETIDSLADCAVRGGFTAVVAMPSDDVPFDDVADVRELEAIARSARCEIACAGSITVGRLGEQLAPMGELAAVGVRYFVDDGVGVQDARVMRRAMEYGAGLGVTLGQHCEVEELADGGQMHEGSWSSRLGLPGVPSEAEELAVARDLVLARLTGVKLHLQHLTTAASLAMVRGAREAGLFVTAEVATQHFTLDESNVADFDPLTKVRPPLRPAADVDAVRAAIRDGLVDAIVSDHTPCTPDDKELPFDLATPGVIGLETVYPLVAEIDAADEVVLSSLTSRPAAIAGVADRHGGPITVGRPANLTVLDPVSEWTWTPEASSSLSTNSPFAGRSLRGRVRHTIVSGRVELADGELTDPGDRR